MPTRKIIVYNCVSCPCGDESRCTYSMIDWETYPESIPEWCELEKGD